MLDIGIDFTDGLREYEIIEYMEQFKMYRLKNYTDNRETELMDKEEINKYLNNKQYYNERLEKNKKYILEAEDQRRLIEKIEREKEEEYNFCYGYVDSKIDIQKGKILKILNKNIIYNGDLITRKQRIHKTLNTKNEVYTEKYLNKNRYKKKNRDLEYVKLKDKLEYRIHYFNKEKNKFLFFEVTKTEYDYCNYLLENKLIS